MNDQHKREQDELDLEPEEIKDLDVTEAESDEVRGGGTCTTKVDPTK
jgi:hypothetical protein